MIRSIRSRSSHRVPLPSPALVVASLALLIALGGVGYAAVVLPANSVGATQIRAGAVASSEVRKGSLLATDLAPAARGSGWSAAAQAPGGAR